MTALNANVVLADKVTGDRVFLKAGSEPPKELMDQLGDHLFADGDKEAKPAHKSRSAK